MALKEIIPTIFREKKDMMNWSRSFTSDVTDKLQIGISVVLCTVIDILHSLLSISLWFLFSLLLEDRL